MVTMHYDQLTLEQKCVELLLELFLVDVPS